MKLTPAASELLDDLVRRLLVHARDGAPRGAAACFAECHGAEADLRDEKSRISKLIVAHGEISLCRPQAAACGLLNSILSMGLRMSGTAGLAAGRQCFT